MTIFDKLVHLSCELYFKFEIFCSFLAFLKNEFKINYKNKLLKLLGSCGIYAKKILKILVENKIQF